MVDYTKQGIVFDIQPFSIHNGPGIRTTVFMKGCPLNCAWCGNPESKTFQPVLLVRDMKCSGCGACVPACSRNAISVTAEGKRVIDWGKCDSCLECVPACLYGSLNRSGETKTVREVMDVVLKDRTFYETSGGGLTVSGGEPLSQAEFVMELFKAAREEGLHTTLDTSGQASWQTFKEVLPYVDLVLYDIKNMDPEKHKEGVGVDNRLILDNFEKAAGMTEVWIRVPLIEGYNDSEENISGIADLAQKHRIKKVSLLPYHEGGEAKSIQIGVPYTMEGAKAPDNKKMAELAEIIKAKCITVVSGS